MNHAKWVGGLAVSMGCLTAGGALINAQVPQAPPVRQDRAQLPQPVYRVAQVPAEPAKVAANNAGSTLPADANAAQHPLVPALEIAYKSLATQANIKDYSATMVKRERINGKLADPEYMFIKVRNQPFSVYLYFLGPDRLRGQECLYVAGANNGNMLAHGVGIKRVAGTVPLLPTGALAMSGQRYPITEIGILNLTKRLVEVGEADKNYGECEVKMFKGAKINKRSSLCIQVVHPTPRKNFKFNLARIFIDDEYNIPVRYEAYDWPEKPGGQPQLLEEYTYTDLKINNGFTDNDFSENNTQYHFH